MKKKILIIVPILIVALIIIVVIPKHNNNDIEETPREVSETSEVSEPTPEPEITPEPEEEKTPEPQPEVQEPTEPEPTEPEPTNPEAVETVEDLEDGINSTHTDVELGDDEYQGDTGADALQSKYDSLSEEDQEMVDEIVEDIMKEHPEWFTDDSSGTSPAPYQGPAVGTPSTGELPKGKFTLGQSGHVEGGENATVY